MLRISEQLQELIKLNKSKRKHNETGNDPIIAESENEIVNL